MGNQESYDRMVRAIVNGAIAMVGAGSSAQVGYPSLGDLLALLAREAIDTYPEREAEIRAMESSADALVRAQEYESILGRPKVRQILSQVYGPDVATFSDFHRDLLRLPFVHLLTTNTDRKFDSAGAWLRGPGVRGYPLAGCLRSVRQGFRRPRQVWLHERDRPRHVSPRRRSRSIPLLGLRPPPPPRATVCWPPKPTTSSSPSRPRSR
jgi:hypothetical protein